MTNDVTLKSENALKTDAEQLKLIGDILYPGAKPESVNLVLSYCKAMNLDPMLKPVHIVPMKGKDTLMPGIGAYRIIAARSGAYAGISEPEFGPVITKQYGNKTYNYPEWCKITVKRIVQGEVCEFTVKEYWIENYASAYGTEAPNMMWAKRAYGQLAKVAESQALRKAFPELVGSLPTAEEMEGKDMVDITPKVSKQSKSETKTFNNESEKDINDIPEFQYSYTYNGKSYGCDEFLEVIQTNIDLLSGNDLKEWKKTNRDVLFQFFQENPELKEIIEKNKKSKEQEELEVCL